MQKQILEIVKLVSVSVHKKKLRKTKGITEYKYGSVRIDNPLLSPFIGKKVRVKIEKA